MVEKKQVVDDLMYKYNGPFLIEDFYKEIESWMSENGLFRDQKNKSEKITQKGKKIEWVVEMWKKPVNDVKQIVKMRVLMNNVKDIKLKRKNKTIKTNQATVIINIDGWIKTILGYRWTSAPVYTFFRTLYDKYIWLIGSNVTEANEGPVSDLCYDLHKRLKGFFELSKMKLK